MKFFIFTLFALLTVQLRADFTIGNPSNQNGVVWQELNEAALNAVGGNTIVAQGGSFESTPFDIRGYRQGIVNATILTTVANTVTCGLRGMDLLKLINVPGNSNYLVTFLSSVTAAVGSNELVFSWSEYSSQSYRQVNGGTNAIVTAPIFGVCPYLKFRVDNVAGAAPFQITRMRIWVKN